MRENKSNRNITVHQFNLGRALTNPGSSDNLRLREKDQIFVFDNGVELDYWYRQKHNAKVSVGNHREARVAEQLDVETGALVLREDASRLDIEGMHVISRSEDIQQTSREKLLAPIIDRLKAQASLKSPARLITISGAVKFPGTYPYAQKQSVGQLIAAAGGLSERAYLAEAEISRTEVVGDQVLNRYQPFSLQEALEGKATDIALRPRDQVMVKTQPNWQQDMVVELQGEVVFPGIYTFQRGDTLKDIVERAGGLTEYAYPGGSVFRRERLKRQEQERLRLLNVQLKQEIASLALRRQSASASYPTPPSEAMQVADELSGTQAMGRLVIDLAKAMEGGSIANIMLEKGDKLYIPSRNPVVSVMGEVQYASSHTYKPNRTLDEYITYAGGTKKQADTDRIYVVRADGSVMLPNNSFWFSREERPLLPGDTIIVPIDTDYMDGLSTLTSATQILYQIGVAWSAVKD